MTSIGIDIGTTSISAVLVEINSGKVLKSITVSNKTDISSNGEEHLQDPEKIFNKVRAIIDEIIEF
nr:FGGY family carbohydrate kinase [Clostridia bacterium]